MIRELDNWLGRVTMYNLLLWGLRVLTAISIGLAFSGSLQLSSWGLVGSLVLLIASCYLTNEVFARIWKVPTNHESYVLTALILFLILPPATTPGRALLVFVAGVIAMASKFLLTVHARHLFNPAALAAVILGFLGLHASWWVGSSLLWPFVLILGLLVIRKIRRFSLFLTFAAVSLLTLLVTSRIEGQGIGEILKFAITSSPLLFLGTIMLTEPATMPARRRQQVIFGALVGFLYSMPWQLGVLNVYPETALVLGNLYAFAVNPRFRARLRLKEVQKVSTRVYNYVFTADRHPQFQPGQYMEWTLALNKVDSRGNRRTFSIASSPTEPDIMLGVKFYEPSSKFKLRLRDMKPNEDIFAGQLAGDFTLPKNTDEKLAFIAGGIGITPFRSMLKYIVDTKQRRDIIMIYAVSDPSEVAYTDVLDEAEAHGIRIIQLLTADVAPKEWKGSTGKLTAEFITEQIPDHLDRAFYLSGPQPMIESLKSTVQKLGAKKIKTDYFTGY
jgi:ferredoxin-NADP reductase/Na+-translocating ferredoxin:NAD+ oxidoreductase RnfD subunit